MKNNNKVFPYSYVNNTLSTGAGHDAVKICILNISLVTQLRWSVLVNVVIINFFVVVFVKLLNNDYASKIVLTLWNRVWSTYIRWLLRVSQESNFPLEYAYLTNDERNVSGYDPHIQCTSVRSSAVMTDTITMTNVSPTNNVICKTVHCFSNN